MLWEALTGPLGGWSNLQQKHVLLKVFVDTPDAPGLEVAHQCQAKNLQLTSEYQRLQDGSAAAPWKGLRSLGLQRLPRPRA